MKLHDKNRKLIDKMFEQLSKHVENKYMIARVEESQNITMNNIDITCSDTYQSLIFPWWKPIKYSINHFRNPRDVDIITFYKNGVSLGYTRC